MNIASIFLGIASIIFAIHALQVKGCLICCTASLATCGGALLCQMLELSRLAAVLDSAAIYDTVNARVLAGAAVLAGNLGLHLAALLMGRKQKCENC